MPASVKSSPFCVSSRQPEPIGERLADLVEDVHRAGLAAAQLLDERDALLQLRLARLELLHLREHRAELLRLASPPRAMSSSRRTRRLSQRPEPPADDQRPCRCRIRLAAMVTRCAAGMHRARRLVAPRSTASRLMRIIGRPPGAARGRPRRPRSARRRPPTRLANFFASNATRLNGSNTSTGASKRSASISVKPSARDAPPLTHDAIDRDRRPPSP